jgi:hypothetical protein
MQRCKSLYIGENRGLPRPSPRLEIAIADLCFAATELGVTAARMAEAFMDFGRAVEEAERDELAVRLKRRAIRRARLRRA